jgi:hypothetical protein
MIFCDHLVNFVLIRYIFTVLVSCTKKNLATLVEDSEIHLYVRICESFQKQHF